LNIWWIRRDIRLHDTPALAGALEKGRGVLPVFVLDEHLLAKPAEKRQAFLFSGLRALEDDLHRLGSGLVVRSGDPAEVLPQLASEIEAYTVYAEEDYSPYAVQRDRELAGKVDLKLVHGLGVHPPALVTKADGSPYTVFTPFSKVWKALPFSNYTHPAPTSLPPLPSLTSEEIPATPSTDHFPTGEMEALRRLDAFLSGPVRDYADARNRMDLDGTSSLSPYLRFGMLSARTAVSAAMETARETDDTMVRKGCEVWINELIWREFYQAILYHFPFVLKTAFNAGLRNIPWRNAPAELQAWQQGLTGYPVVDAAMRQLNATGWMHNRARMITASFLVKDLLINWQEGERWFMQNLVDGDPAANNGSWQWTAGTGTDAAPYFRIFNPVLQGKKFDPLGVYVRRWVPELANVPDRYIHTPWEMSPLEQSAVNVIIGRNYPQPIVDHASARERTLKAYKGG